ncbi:hypothetical protein DYB28_009013 [Aphanomyces astaci]|uniref:HTH CENPB-type domain-containing protein n=1 Tax=Aphanomyces astaci TaxID=112090 RepID=A0A9X8HE95_APHAT|nr:hypothetical protein DYB28_009013 [Aphanomyces astaci]
MNAIQRVAELGMSAFLDGYCVNATPTQRDTTRKKVYGWIKQKDRIHEMATETRTSQEQLARWVLGMRKDGIPVTYYMLRVMALETAIDLGLTEDEFKAGWHWVRSFKRRHGLSLRAKTRTGQDSSQDGTATLADFSQRVFMCAMANDVDVIYNADQTSKVIILRDDFSAHFTDDVVAYAESINIILQRVPPRFTWCWQPADVAWIRPLKTNLRDRWLVEIRLQLWNSKAVNRNLKLAGPSRSTMVEWITGAWNEVPESVILNGFRKCQLVDGAVVEAVLPGDSLDVGDIADLMADSAVEETIDPALDIDAIDAISSPEIVSL